MKKQIILLTFIFLTGLFAGIFFCTGINNENREYLSNLLFSASSGSDTSFMRYFITNLFSHCKFFLIMLPALFIKPLAFLPPASLFAKSFSLGFCSGLVYISDLDTPLLFSAVHIIPQSIFFIPAYVLFASAVLHHSFKQKNRSLSLDDKDLKLCCIISFFLLFTGIFIETVFR